MSKTTLLANLPQEDEQDPDCTVTGARNIVRWFWAPQTSDLFERLDRDPRDLGPQWSKFNPATQRWNLIKHTRANMARLQRLEFNSLGGQGNHALERVRRADLTDFMVRVGDPIDREKVAADALERAFVALGHMGGNSTETATLRQGSPLRLAWLDARRTLVALGRLS